MSGHPVHKTQKIFLDIPTAAAEAGYSTRQFRRIIEEDRISVMRIGHKHFIVAGDFKTWKLNCGEARLQQRSCRKATAAA